MLKLISRRIPLSLSSNPAISCHVDRTIIGSLAVIPQLPVLAAEPSCRFSSVATSTEFVPKITLGRVINPKFTKTSITTKVKSFATGEDLGSIELSKQIFDRPIRKDLLHRLVVWQQAKSRQGTAKSKNRAEVRGSKKKVRNQKGTGMSRAGSRRAPNFKGGGRAWPKIPRSFEYDLPKKVKRLGLATALSVKLAAGKLVVVDSIQLDSHKTKGLAGALKTHGLEKPLLVDRTIAKNVELAAFKLPKVDLLPVAGLNVLSILKCDELVMTREAVDATEKAFTYSFRPRFPTVVATPESGFTPESLAQHQQQLAAAKVVAKNITTRSREPNWVKRRGKVDIHRKLAPTDHSQLLQWQAQTAAGRRAARAAEASTLNDAADSSA
eukprot:TRINITY_DN22487_c0_g1_i1.p1 TRINITY_DN22487_c0_g1~~TRINITY_DN22487_c0_g1_i1.p1  ORF type:complete len:382 (+),score=96.56 TRINITY_DN22487_c0_g1_i1:86-1231(+)